MSDADPGTRLEISLRAIEQLEAERDRLLHVYNKSVLVRGAALAELKKRGVDVSDLTAL